MQVNFSNHMGKLVDILGSAVATKPSQVVLRNHEMPVFMDPQSAMLCELIVTELVSNSLKHGLPSRDDGEVLVTVESLHGSEIMIEVSDNGVGLPQDFSIDKPATQGFKMVNAMVERLGGKLRVKSEHGTSFILNFSENGLPH